MKLTSAAGLEIDKAIKAATADPHHSMPRAVFMATSSNGILYSGADGAAQVSVEGGVEKNSDEVKITENSIFELWSCTKLVTVIAALQLIEKGVMKLTDDASQWCPELANIEILQELEKDGDGKYMEPVLVKKERAITIEMLINHTAGFTYFAYLPKHNRYRIKHGLGAPYANGTTRECVTKMPLMFQPGEHWFYGTSNDWLGIAIENASGLSLEAYFQKHIFKPLGIEDMSFVHNSSCVNMAYANEKNPSDTYKFKPATHFSEDPMGGAGLMGSPASYLKILKCLLNDGRSSVDGQPRVLGAETVALMFQNSLHEEQQQQDVAFITKHDLDPFSRNSKNAKKGVNWGYGGALSGEGYASGRSKGSLTWAGYTSCFWVVDKEKDVAFVLFSSILPIGMQPVFDFWEIAETELYKGLGLHLQKACL